MARHSTSLVLFLLFEVITAATEVQAARAGGLTEQQLEASIVEDERIVGGTPTTTFDFPWQLYVLARTKGKYYSCGGSIISWTWSMSAAHCFANKKLFGHVVVADRILLYAGVTYTWATDSISDPDVQVNVFNLQDFENHVFVHQGYTTGARYNNDITLFKNKIPWVLHEKVAPIVLAEVDDFIVGKELNVSGWGKTCENCNTSDILLWVDGLKLISRDECTDYWGASRITDNMICHKTADANTCGGDSGGPVITGSGNSNGPPYVQIGIVSWGSSDCGAFVPKVFVDVAKYRNWINGTMSGCKVDSHRKCSEWANKGKCRKGRYFNKCKTSCACGVGSNPPCEDSKKKCTTWAAEGKCNKGRVYVKCKSSCGCGQ